MPSHLVRDRTVQGARKTSGLMRTWRLEQLGESSEGPPNVPGGAVHRARYLR